MIYRLIYLFTVVIFFSNSAVAAMQPPPPPGFAQPTSSSINTNASDLLRDINKIEESKKQIVQQPVPKTAPQQELIEQKEKSDGNNVADRANRGITPPPRSFSTNKTTNIPPELAVNKLDEQNNHIPPVLQYHNIEMITFDTIRDNNLEGFRAILNKTKNTSIINQDGENLATYAAVKMRSNFYYAMANNLVDLNAVNRGGAAALHISIINNDLEGANILLSLGANPDIRDVKGQTPLMYAATLNNQSAIRLLLNRGANIYLRDSADHDAMGIAAIYRNAEIVQLIYEKKHTLERLAPDDQIVIQKTSEQRSGKIYRLSR